MEALSTGDPLIQRGIMGFNSLVHYFSDPDLPLPDTEGLGADAFARDLEAVMEELSEAAAAHRGRLTITRRPAPVTAATPKTPRGRRQRARDWITALFLGKEEEKKADATPAAMGVETRTWVFDQFDPDLAFGVLDLYVLYPLSLTFTSEKDASHRQIRSLFRIQPARGAAKTLCIIDTLEGGRITREKEINGRAVAQRNFEFDIRSHRLNRGLMRAFLRHQFAGGTGAFKPSGAVTPPMFSLELPAPEPGPKSPVILDFSGIRAADSYALPRITAAAGSCRFPHPG